MIFYDEMRMTRKDWHSHASAREGPGELIIAGRFDEEMARQESGGRRVGGVNW